MEGASPAAVVLLAGDRSALAVCKVLAQCSSGNLDNRFRQSGPTLRHSGQSLVTSPAPMGYTKRVEVPRLL